MDKEKFSRQFKSVRLLMKLTQVQIAAKIGINPSMVSRWERGDITRMPHPLTLRAIKKVMPQVFKSE